MTATLAQAEFHSLEPPCMSSQLFDWLPCILFAIRALVDCNGFSIGTLKCSHLPVLPPQKAYQGHNAKHLVPAGIMQEML
jgi:hypothetical protein